MLNSCVMHRHTGPAPVIMVWGGIGYHSCTPLVRIAITLNSQCYISKILEPVVLPYLQNLATAIFQQDKVSRGLPETKKHGKGSMRQKNSLLKIAMTPSGASALSFFIASLLLIIAKSAEPPVVPYPPTIVKQPPHEQLYQVAQTQDEKDNPFMLECEAQGNPEPVYRWMKNGLDFEYVAYDKRISQQPRRGTLVFTKPEDIDEGLYQCFASNRFGTSVSNAVFLRKSELSSFLDVEAKEKVVSEGDPLSLNCNPPTGYPRPTIFWMIQSYTGSLRTINSSRITVDPEGDLHFSNVTIEDDLDEAMYACSATSKSRNEYKFGNKIILKVDPSGGSGQTSHRPVKQYVSPPNIVALRGKQLELSCIFGGTPLPEIKWSKRRSEMYSNKYTYINYGKTLHIKSVDFDDAGTYECVGSNGVGTPITHAMTIAVHAIPYWITAPNNTNAAEEEIVKFVCDARAYPEPKLQWLINGEPIEKAQPNPRRKLEGNMMIIDRLEKSDTAVYQCNASNVHGYAFKDFYLNVLALPPTIVEEPEPLTKAVVTSLVTLICRVFGAPKPEVRWSKEGQELSGGRYQVLDNGDLHISNALKTDEGMYTCSASNKLGDTQAQGKLEVKGEVASADEEAARKYPEKLAKIIKDGEYCAHQVFNADETGLFWKKMPTRTYIAKSEKTASGFKAAKDRVTLLLCSNASGDRMLKPLLVNRSLKPRALKGKDLNTLPVHWMANKKAWVTTAIFTEWFNKCFVPRS
ncbi:neuroglian [Trichonephila clavipes]|uniref:Neuroglian n=1 Tax=Trichonephila clavipes TaxID=2585209 RepID=A0A8X6S613_TRICX|nr:neuroglian [Trichonephila clavipes]